MVFWFFQKKRDDTEIKNVHNIMDILNLSIISFFLKEPKNHTKIYISLFINFSYKKIFKE